MSIAFEPGLYVRIEQREPGPHPKPLEHGFSPGREYRVLGMYNPSESGECWLVLSNDRSELWFISQRHVRTTSLEAHSQPFHRPLPEAGGLVDRRVAGSTTLCEAPAE